MKKIRVKQVLDREALKKLSADEKIAIEMLKENVEWQFFFAGIKKGQYFFLEAVRDKDSPLLYLRYALADDVYQPLSWSEVEVEDE